MDRTPIKIPGKNTRDLSKAAIVASKKLNRPRGRPPKLTPSNEKSVPPPAAPTYKSKKRSLRHIKSRRNMSNFEKLPTELLVDIFLYSMNIDLPRSSPIISGKLTSELVYTRTIIAAFCPTWDMGYGHFDRHNAAYTLSGFPPVFVHPVIRVGDGALQSAVLRCRWASLPVIHKSQEIWADRYCKERPFRPLPFIEARDIEVESQLQKDRLENKLTPAKYFEEDFALFSSFLQRRYEGDANINSTTYVDVAKGLEIPHSLLLGPWTEDMTRYLYWLVKGGAKFDWLNSTAGEAAMIGFKTAVGEGDLRVIHLLLWAGLWERIDIEIVIWTLRTARKQRFNVIDDVCGLWIEKHNMTSHEASRIEDILTEIRDQAEEKDDQDTLDFVEATFRLFAVVR